MTRVAVYEYCTATATGPGRGEPDPVRSLAVKGRAMRDAVAADFAGLLGRDNVLTPPTDPPVPWDKWFRACLPVVDWFVVIAPEIDDLLASHVDFLESHGGRVLGCSAAAVRLTSDKLVMANHWHRRGVRTPVTMPAR
ncbi:MAG: hypothetical protein ACRC7O_12120, partial [Fimbriiglobus sp.]